MPRYVILVHDLPYLHWDLLLEQPAAERLRAWRLLTEPAPETLCRAEPLPDHRPVYLDYEGPVSGGRGTVQRWDWGEYAVVDSPGSELSLRCQGRRGLVLARLCSDPTGPVWRFTSS